MGKIKEAQQPEPRVDEVFSARFLVLIAVIVVITAGVLFASLLPEVTTAKRQDHQTQAEDELLAQLDLLRSTWEPAHRQRLLDDVPARAEAFSGPLHRILRMDDHRLLEQAVEYAGVLGNPTLRPPLVQLATAQGSLPPAIRYRAVHSAEHLGPWSVGRLAGFLTHGTVPVKLAALEISANRSDAPWPEILDLLVVRDARDFREDLHRAAIQAIPKNAPARLRQELATMLAHGEPEEIKLGLRVLSRTGFGADVEAKILALLERSGRATRMVCLDVLGNRQKKLANPGPVWAVAQDPQPDLQLRARALYCLEQTRSFEATNIREAVFGFGPLMRYFAARCLITTGGGEGFDTLLDLLHAEDDGAALATRRLLAWLTGRSPGSSRSEFAASLTPSVGSGRGDSLPAPGYVFDAAPSHVSDG